MRPGSSPSSAATSEITEAAVASLCTLIRKGKLVKTEFYFRVGLNRLFGHFWSLSVSLSVRYLAASCCTIIFPSYQHAKHEPSMLLCCFSLTWGCSRRWVELPAVGRSGAGMSGCHGCWGSRAYLPLLLQLHLSPWWQRHLWHSSWARGSGLSMPLPLLASQHTAWKWNIYRWTVSSTKKCSSLQPQTLCSCSSEKMWGSDRLGLYE